jgi:hypothetical protein
MAIWTNAERGSILFSGSREGDMTKTEMAIERWGGARIIQGHRDPVFLQTHRTELVSRLVSRGLSPADAAALVARKIAVAEQPCPTDPSPAAPAAGLSKEA